MLIPVIKAMRKFGYNIISLGLTTASNSLKKHNIPYIGFKDIIENSDIDAKLVGEELAGSFKDTLIVDYEETIAYLGLSFIDLVNRFGIESAKIKYSQEGRNSFLPLTIMERFLVKINPDLVVTTNSPRTEKAVLLEARKLSIPSICIVDLFDSREIEDRIGKAGYADKVCVFSEGVKQCLIKAGRKASEIVVTGNPDFDELSSPLLKAKALETRLKYGDYEYVVLWVRHAGKLNFELNNSIDSKLIEVANNNRDILFIFRPHPNEPKEYSKLPANIVVSILDDDIQILLLGCNLVLTIASTVGLQAVACGIPLITFDMGPTAKYTPYSKMGLSCGINNLENLEDCIRQQLGATPGYETEIKYYASATQKVVDLAERLLSD